MPMAASIRTGLARPAIVLQVALIAATLASSKADEIDDYLESQRKSRHIPGLSLAVVDDGRVVKIQGYGLANLELRCPASEETVYEIGSITKQFTATVVMMLVEEGKIDLDAPISTYLNDLPEAWSGVNVRHLLNHTSGIKNYTSVTDFLKLARTDHTQKEILELVSGLKLEFEPGESWAYNNTGYYLLGMIIEKVTGTRLADVMAERIFQPLEMTQTRPSHPTAIILNRAHGYGQILGIVGNRDPITPSAAFAAGFLLSTVGDLVKWDAALREGKLLKASSAEQMYEPTKLKNGETRPYGFGWATRSIRDHRVLEHAGGTAGFSTAICRYPDDRLTVIVLTNLASESAAELAHEVAKRYRPELSIALAKAIDDPDPNLTERLRTVYESLLNGEVDAEAFTTKLKDHLESKDGRAVAKSLASSGDWKAFELIGLKTKDGKESTREYRLVLGETTYLVTFHFDRDGKISGLFTRKDQ